MTTSVTRIHEPVMADEVLERLAPAPGSVILDLTVGAGGHASRILDVMGATGRVIGIDRDADILDEARATLEPFGERAALVHARSDELARVLAEQRIAKVDGILLDLGVSSLQLDDASRGFSFQGEGPLDMRMDRSRGRTARELLARADAAALERILREYGEEPFARRVAAALADAARRQPFRTTRELAEFVASLVPARLRGRSRVHPATRVFQALRIAVNEELKVLARTLPAALDALAPDGRLAVIAFHSLEDRIVKNVFRDAARAGQVELLTKKPDRPTDEEVARNPRSRSARLRAVRLGAPPPRRGGRR